MAETYHNDPYRILKELIKQNNIREVMRYISVILEMDPELKCSEDMRAVDLAINKLYENHNKREVGFSF